MSISDGYGDLDTEAEVARFWAWSHAVAGRMVQPSSLLYEDLVQESLIHIWQLIERKGGRDAVSATYLARAARYRMLQVVLGRPQTGGDSKPGPKSRPVEVGVDWLDEDSPLARLSAADALGAVALAYHEGEIVAAINALPLAHREYVVLRFWGGLTDTEISARVQTSNQALHVRWKRVIKPKLSEALFHLSGFSEESR